MDLKHFECYSVERKKSNLSQKAAAEMLGVAAKTLSSYETGRQIPPPDVVSSMSNIYKSFDVKNTHCKFICDLADERGEKHTSKNIFQTGYSLLYIEDDIDLIKTKLLNILKDGEIDSEEVVELKNILPKIHDLKGVISQIEREVRHEIHNRKNK